MMLVEYAELRIQQSTVCYKVIYSSTKTGPARFNGRNLSANTFTYNVYLSMLRVKPESTAAGEEILFDFPLLNFEVEVTILNG